MLPRKGIGIHLHVRVHTSERIGHMGTMGSGGYVFTGLIDIIIQGCILQRAVVRGKLMGGILFVDLDFLASDTIMNLRSCR